MSPQIEHGQATVTGDACARGAEVAAVVDGAHAQARGRGAVHVPGVRPARVPVAGCHVAPSSVDTSTPATTPPPVSAAVPLTVDLRCRP